MVGMMAGGVKGLALDLPPQAGFGEGHACRAPAAGEGEAGGKPGCIRRSGSECSGGVEEVHHVTVLHDVGFAFGAEFAMVAGAGFALVGDEV